MTREVRQMAEMLHDAKEASQFVAQARRSRLVTEYRAVCGCGTRSDWYRDLSLAIESRDVMNGGSIPDPEHGTTRSDPCCDREAIVVNRSIDTDTDRS